MEKTAVFWLSLTAICNGFFIVTIKHLLNSGINYFSLAASMAIFVLLFSGGYGVHRLNELKKIGKQDWIKLFVIGFLATFLGRILLVSGQAFTTAVHSGFLMKMTSLTTIPFAYFLVDEQIKKKTYLSLILMLSGAFLLITKGTFGAIKEGDFVILSLVGILGFTNALAKKVMKNVDSRIVSSLRLFIGSFLLLGTIPLFKGVEKTFSPLLENPLLMLFAGALGFTYITSFYEGVNLAGASKAAIFMLSGAIVSALGAIFFLGEPFSLIEGAGGLLILVGAFLLTRKKEFKSSS